jgi:RND family efflux transporter MFP subunit
MNPLKLRTAVQERHAALMKPGLRTEFYVESIPGEVFPGRLAYISPAVDQATRTFPVEIMVDNNDHRLKPGFFAKGSILTQRDENVLAVPDSAISTLAGESSVFVVARNKVRKQPVSLGGRVENLVEIVTGLKGDEILAATNLNELADGVLISTGGAEPEGDSEEGRQARPGRGKRGGRQ